MSNHPTPEHYRPAQIALHWVVVVGVIKQIIVHEQIVRIIINVMLFVQVIGHAAAACYNHFVRKEGALNRMSLTRDN